MYTVQHLYSQNHAYSPTFIQSKPYIQHNYDKTKRHYGYFKLYIACSTEKYVLVPDMKWLRTYNVYWYLTTSEVDVSCNYYVF
jgi:hypothetical protein